MRARTKLVRPRLLNQLATVQEHRLTLIHAAPGFGKTTLLKQWQPPQAIHLALTADDNDPERFKTRLLAALDTAYATTRTNITALAPEHLATELLNTLARCTQATTVILDNYEQITHPALLGIVEQAAEYAPPALHLIIATCRAPALPLGRLRARGQLLELRDADLAFTVAETTAYLSAASGMLDPAVCVALHRGTGGWVAALQRAATLLAAGVPSTGIVQRLETDPVLARYLAASMDASDTDAWRLYPLFEAFRRRT